MNFQERTSAISLEAVSKRFGETAAVREVSLDIRDGEFFSMLGPSGCGKTTTLRMIAGFESPDSGRVLLRGEDVTAVPANHRKVNMVFQQYALFPHMNVFDNVAFGLRINKFPRDEIRRRVLEMLEVVSLEGMEKRRPQQLSGGEQQRVALARALVNGPAAILLDEPLGALDVKLRKQMQLELKRIQHELGTTFIHVTHDQEEALSMSDRIAVMNHGIVEQIGAPNDIYERPATPFVADFVGVLNSIDLRVEKLAGEMAVMERGSRQRVVGWIPTARVGEEYKVGVRPEKVRVAKLGSATGEEDCVLEGTVDQVVYLGTLTQVLVRTRQEKIVAHELSGGPAGFLTAGDQVTVSWMSQDTLTLGLPPAGASSEKPSGAPTT